MPMTSLDIMECDAIHKALYKAFVWQSDQKTFGKPEHWDHPQKFGDKFIGDCDDFAMQIDTNLSASAFPFRDRRFAVCSMSGSGIDHCALALIAVDGIWISECNSPRLMPIKKLPYSKWYWSDPDDITADWVQIPGV